VEDGKMYGYHVNRSKSWLIVKNPDLEKEAKAVFGDSVNITTEGQRHLGAVIGSRAFKKLYCNEKINEWMKELLALCEIADTHPQAAYSAYAKGFKSKFNYFLPAIENFEEFVEPIDNLIS